MRTNSMLGRCSSRAKVVARDTLVKSNACPDATAQPFESAQKSRVNLFLRYTFIGNEFRTARKDWQEVAEKRESLLSPHCILLRRPPTTSHRSP